MRGHGDSAWSPEGAYLVQDYVKDLEALVAQLRLRRVTLLGNSTGGRVVQVFAGLHPDLVERLIVEDVGPERPRNIADAFARRVEQEANGWASEDELVRQLVEANPRTPEPLLRTYAHFGVKPRPDGRLVWKRDPNLVKGFVETELWDSVSKITSPALYVIGGASRIVPPETQQRLKDTLPNCRIVVMPGLGHYPNEEDTAGFMKSSANFLRTRRNKTRCLGNHGFQGARRPRVLGCLATTVLGCLATTASGCSATTVSRVLATTVLGCLATTVLGC